MVEEENRLQRLIERYKKGKLNIFIVGAGALANFVAISLSSLRLGKITIFDQDKIEETNLNRQVLYFDAVGDYKSMTLKKRLKELSKYNIYDYKIKLFDSSAKSYFGWFSNKPDIILDCVDNFETRSLLNKFAIKYQIPLISGGTSPLAGQVVVYFPGMTSCLNCELDIDRLAEERERQRQGCTAVPEGSVVTTNQIIGGIMVGEIYRLLNGVKPVSGTIKYLSSDDERIGFVADNKICKCNQNKMELPKAQKATMELPRFGSILKRIKSFFIEKEL